VAVQLKRIDVPGCDGGAPCPVVLADENSLVFGCCEQLSDRGDSNCIITVRGCLVLKFGYPNDEVLQGHRYADAGLEHYSAYEVLNSEWIQELMIANRVHSRHSNSHFDKERHFIFTFHDSTLEFVASDDFTVSRAAGSLRSQVVTAFERVQQSA